MLVNSPVIDEILFIVLQFYRTFLISFLTIFIVNPIYRQAAFLLTLVVFVTHDRYRKPFINGFLNQLQLFSSICLLLVLGCNTLSAYSYMVNITLVPLVFEAKKIFAVAEMPWAYMGRAYMPRKLR